MENRTDGKISYREVLCHCWQLVFSSSLDSTYTPKRYLQNSCILKDQRASYMVLH